MIRVLCVTVAYPNCDVCVCVCVNRRVYIGSEEFCKSIRAGTLFPGGLKVPTCVPQGAAARSELRNHRDRGGGGGGGGGDLLAC
jgi:hypothetical protein